MHFQPPYIDTQQFKMIKIIYFHTKTPPGAVLKISQWLELLLWRERSITPQSKAIWQVLVALQEGAW